MKPVLLRVKVYKLLLRSRHCLLTVTCRTPGCVLAESMRVNVTVANEQAILSGQTQALMIAGIAEFTSLRMRVAPGTYNLSMSLPNYPEVWPPNSCLASISASDSALNICKERMSIADNKQCCKPATAPSFAILVQDEKPKSSLV